MPLRPSKRGPLDPQAARNAALRLLGRREHSARELAAKLEARGIDEATASEVIVKLGEAGWQSDARYAETLVRSRIAQGYGPLRIEAELEVAGIAESAAREAIAASETDWAVLAAELRSRRFGPPPQALAEAQKQFRYLAGRGFSHEQVRKALKGAPVGEDD